MSTMSPTTPRLVLPEPWQRILEDARRYPSPHNSQPIKVGAAAEGTALEVFYDLDLGLPAESFGIPFAHVCAGVFLASLETCAAGHGCDVVIDENHREMDFTAADRLHPIATVRLEPRVGDPDTDQQAWSLLGAFRHRQTSRRPYDSRTVNPAVTARVARLAERYGHEFSESHDEPLVERVIRVNQETLFTDLRNDAVHQEILTWLRTSRRRAARTGDGLSAETMRVPGPVLSFAMKHREIWRWPVLGAVVRRAYLATMRGVSQVAWFAGPFGGPADYLAAGRLFLRAWLEFDLAGVSLHPLGTVVTNPDSHAEFVSTVGAQEGDGRMVWMLVRLGYSKKPPVAHRRSLASMLLPSVVRQEG